MQSSVLLLSLHHLQGTEATQRSLAIVGELSHFAFLNHPFSWARGYLSTSAWTGPKHSATCRTVHAQDSWVVARRGLLQAISHSCISATA